MGAVLYLDVVRIATGRGKGPDRSPLDAVPVEPVGPGAIPAELRLERARLHATPLDILDVIPAKQRVGADGVEQRGGEKNVWEKEGLTLHTLATHPGGHTEATLPAVHTFSLHTSGLRV